MRVLTLTELTRVQGGVAQATPVNPEPPITPPTLGGSSGRGPSIGGGGGGGGIIIRPPAEDAA